MDQEPLLFEHLTIFQNISFAMRLQQRSASEIQQAVAKMFQAIDLVGHENKREWQLSGGQKQRVAFARALLAEPRLLLLDEPFSSLDSKTRGQMQGLFHRLSRHYEISSIFVTHDIKEALLVGSRFARMVDGNLSLYPNRDAFISDPETGALNELNFWRQSTEQIFQSESR